MGSGKYKWYRNNTEIENEVEVEISISVAGTYHVENLADETNCPRVYYPSSPIQFNYIKPVLAGNVKLDLYRVTLSTIQVFDSYQWYQTTDTTLTPTAINRATAETYNATITNHDVYFDN